MPVLNWVGKEQIINHHKKVQYHVLNGQYSFDKTGQHKYDKTVENMVIQGDNLDALKTLLPKYEGKIKCVYIDPPYNTGNKDWCYNDNVDAPIFQKWLQDALKEKESERFVHIDDLNRHDKWLCMMYPRLKLIHKLMSKDGVIFVSIDDNEFFNLKCICDEIFGANNCIATLVWKKKSGGGSDTKFIAVDHEYVLVYAKDQSIQNRWFIPMTDEQRKDYKYKDSNYDRYGPYKIKNLYQSGIDTNRPNLRYAITSPEGTEIWPPTIWRWSKETFNEALSNDEIEFVKKKDGTWNVYTKMYLHKGDSEYQVKPRSILLNSGMTRDGNKEIKELFGESVFDYPKPTKLIMDLISIVTNDGDVILDSFAGSGTTAHAILKLNKNDGEQRKFIMIEQSPDYADAVTAERVKRVISGYGNYAGIDSSFSFYTLGEPLFVDDCLNEKVDTELIREYIYYSETKQQYNKDCCVNDFHLGTSNGTAYYFYYETNQETVLNEASFEQIKTDAQGHVIFADSCVLSKEQLQKNGIIFKKIPRDISRV